MGVHRAHDVRVAHKGLAQHAMLGIIDLIQVTGFGVQQDGAEEELEEEDPEEEDQDEDGGFDFFDAQEASPVELDFSVANKLADDPAALVAHFDLLLTYGSLSSEMSAIIQRSVSQLSNTEQRVKMALYLISISPDFAVLK